MRLLATVLTAATIAGMLAGQTQAASAKHGSSCKGITASINYQRAKAWQWQRKLAVKPTRASLRGAELMRVHSCRYLSWIQNLWQKRAESLETHYNVLRKTLRGSPSSLTTRQLYSSASWEIRHGGIYSSRWGDASPRLKEVCYELVRRAFAPYGRSDWAYYIVNRESGCNPGAVNSSSGTTGIAQFMPSAHTWVDYYRLKRDMRYAIWTFLRLSRNGQNTGPWCLC